MFKSPFFTSLCKQTHLRPPNLRLQQHRRTFVNARVKWVPDPCLDFVVQREKNLKSILALKTFIQSSPTKSIPITTASSHKHHHLHLPTTTTTATFVQTYPSVFQQFRPFPLSIPHIRLTQRALVLHSEESAIHDSPPHRNDAVVRLIKLLMLTGAMKLPLRVVDSFRFDLGLPHNYILTLLSDYPECFHVSKFGDSDDFCLELVKWRDDLAVSVMEKRANCGCKKGMRLSFPMQLPNGFDLEKKVQNWVDEWQNLPYISPYENGFHLNPRSDQAEKWTVAVLHELLHLLVSKKTEKGNVYGFGDWLGFDELRFRHALRHHPGIFYVSSKIRTQTVVLREGYRKDFLVEKHPLMGMRYRYIHLMNKSMKRRKRVDIHLMNKSKKQPKKVGVLVPGLKKTISLNARTSGERENSGEEEELEGSSDSEFEDSDDDVEMGSKI